MQNGRGTEGNVNDDNSFEAVGALGLLAKKFEMYTVANREIIFYVL